MKPNRIAFTVWGRYALFSDPLTRVGGEKYTYPIPTYQALKGIVESVYWKPTLVWVVDRMRVMNPIENESKGMRPIKYGSDKNELAYYTYLRNVAYQVEAHFEWNENRPDLAADRDENKHHEIARRMVARGGRRDVFLGTRECQAYVEPAAFGEGEGAYDGVNMDFGLMFHGFTYPDEAVRPEERGKLTARFFTPRMRGGIIEFPRPEACTVRRVLRDMPMKAFGRANFSGLQEFEVAP